MTRDETIAFWKECEGARVAELKAGKSEDEAREAAKSIWNKWADARSAEFKQLVKTGETLTPRHQEGRRTWRNRQSTEIKEWLDRSRVDFSGITFQSKSGLVKSVDTVSVDTASAFTSINFHGFQFPGEADFTETSFLTDVVFDHAKFVSHSWFRAANFSGIAYFYDCQFNGNVWFTACHFEKEVNFVDAHFGSETYFIGIKSLSFVNMTNTCFAVVPRFNQASFAEAPDFDNLEFPILSFFGASEPSLTSRYRALRRLANQGHDHENEAKAFKGEIRSKRGISHKIWHAAFWFGAFYDAISDFGRSMTRPFYLWLLSIPLFMWAYLAHAGKVSVALTACYDGTSTWLKSLLFSLKSALLFVPWDREQIRSAYACLYPQLKGPEVGAPTAHAFIQAAQSVWSALLIFLFILAVRNQFRIK